MRLTVLPDERFTCQCCAQCCHHWHVELLDEERSRLAALDWPAEHADLRGLPFTQNISGRAFLRHASDGACVFLDRGSKLCRIHAAFGEPAKPLGCRLFPFSLTATFGDQVTVTARSDCPTVRANLGKPHAEHRADLQRLAAELKPQPFGPQTLLGLDRQDVERMTQFLADELEAAASNDERALLFRYFLAYVTQPGEEPPRPERLRRWRATATELIDRAIDGYDDRPPPAAVQMAFRSLLGVYLRRDEDVVDGRAGRWSRAWALFRLAAGRGSMRALGVNHPEGDWRRARLFEERMELAAPEALSPVWRVVINRLRTLQFMGDAHAGEDFVCGLGSLCLFYPLALAVAKYARASAGRAAVEAADAELGAQAIDHSFGRSRLLATASVRRNRDLVLQPDVYARLVLSL